MARSATYMKMRSSPARTLSLASGRGGPTSAMTTLMSLDAYERSEAEREILLLLVRGEKEIAAGVGFTLDQIMAEADSVLSED
jgi:hypothetical protein